MSHIENNNYQSMYNRLLIIEQEINSLQSNRYFVILITILVLLLSILLIKLIVSLLILVT